MLYLSGESQAFENKTQNIYSWRYSLRA